MLTRTTIVLAVSQEKRQISKERFQGGIHHKKRRTLYCNYCRKVSDIEESGFYGNESGYMKVCAD
jgi:DNA invertase Pin-like site-specific DNA recombinase